MKDTRTVDVDLVEPNPYQSCLEFDDEVLMDLAQSVRENGLIQPITVREMDGRYQIAAGERRSRALKLNGAVDIPALIVDANEVQMAEMALVENIQRENLSVIKEAKSYAEIMKYSGLNQSQLVLRVGKDQPSTANKICLLNLDEGVQEAASTKKISEWHARALIGLDEEKQHDALEKTVKKGMTVAQTEKMLREQAQPKKEKKKVMLRGINKNIKIVINMIYQTVSMVNRVGAAAEINEEEYEDEVIIIIRIPKQKGNDLIGKIIAVSNQKGDVDKTTISIDLAAGLGYLSNKVLLVDFDPRGNATQGAGAEAGEDRLSVYNLTMEDYKMEDTRKKLTFLPIDIVPASITLAGADLQMVKFEAGKEGLLKNKLELIKDKYDFIIIDCPSSLGLLNTNALVAADSVIIPVQCEYYVLEGVTQLLLIIRLIQQLSNRNLMIEGVVLTTCDARTKLSVEVQQEVRQHFKDRVYKNYIPRNVKLSEIPSRGMSIFEYDVRCEGAKAYAELLNEAVKMNRKTKARQGGG